MLDIMGTFIIAVIVVIILKFAIDSFSQSREVKSVGGARQKYAVIVDHLLASDPSAKIYQQSNTFVSVGVSGMAGSQVYYIQPTFGNVTIQMQIKNNPLFGDVKMEWTFPDAMDQNRMIEKIESDILAKMNSLV